MSEIIPRRFGLRQQNSISCMCHLWSDQADVPSRWHNCHYDFFMDHVSWREIIVSSMLLHFRQLLLVARTSARPYIVCGVHHRGEKSIS